MKSCKMNTKVNALIKKVEEVQSQTVEILGRLNNWKAYPNECASSDSVIEKALADIGKLWLTASDLNADADKVSSIHTNDVVGMVADKMSKRPISRKNYKE